MKKTFKKILRRLANSKFSGLLSLVMRFVVFCQRGYYHLKWKLQGAKNPEPEDIALMRENVTFIFKSFQRQRMAKQLYWNIQKYYPGVRVIIADDSAKPLDLQDDHAEVIQLPFNSGLSYGINRALEKVETPFVIRMDDDELLTPYTNFHGQLRFLLEHPEVDLAAVAYIPMPLCPPLEKTVKAYYAQNMSNALRPLKIPHLTPIDEKHIVIGKPPNLFIARTQALRTVGYDDQIRMMDHNEFFFRAAGILVSVLDPTAFVLHRHDSFNRNYQNYRNDTNGDYLYIRTKLHAMLKKQKEESNTGSSSAS